MSFIKCIASITLLLLVAACSKEGSKPTLENVVDKSEEPMQTSVDDSMKLEVFKTPTCGCCGDWVVHVENQGFAANVKDQDSLSELKDSLRIPEDARSCHVGVSKQGYFFEGHVPAKYIKQFLSSPPEDALGLAVPGMPVGSPGMEIGEQFDPYAVMLVHKDGSMSVYAELQSYKDQF